MVIERTRVRIWLNDVNLLNKKVFAEDRSLIVRRDSKSVDCADVLQTLGPARSGFTWRVAVR